MAHTDHSDPYAFFEYTALTARISFMQWKSYSIFVLVNDRDLFEKGDVASGTAAAIIEDR